MVNFRDCIAQIDKYVAGKPIDEVKREFGLSKVVKLASNENPLGCSKKVKEVLRKTIKNTHFYPDSSSYKLKKALSEFYNVPKNFFCLGTGSDNLIELIPQLYINSGDEVIVSKPTFPLYKTHSILAGANVIEVPLRDGFTYDFNDLYNAISQKTKIIFLCNPNNPTGTGYSQNEQLDFIRKVDKYILIVIDEAYYEYVKRTNYPDSLSLLNEYDNIIILRTFSKIYGLASLRVGYAISNPSIIEKLECIRGPFNVNLFAQEAATVALSDQEFVQKSIAQNEKGKKYLYQQFEKLNIQYFPTDTNFVMIDIKQSAEEAFIALLKHGFIVRPFNETLLRVGIGTIAQLKGFMLALKIVLNK